MNPGRDLGFEPQNIEQEISNIEVITSLFCGSLFCCSIFAWYFFEIRNSKSEIRNYQSA